MENHILIIVLAFVSIVVTILFVGSLHEKFNIHRSVLLFLVAAFLAGAAISGIMYGTSLVVASVKQDRTAP